MVLIIEEKGGNRNVILEARGVSLLIYGLNQYKFSLLNEMSRYLGSAELRVNIYINPPVRLRIFSTLA